MTSAAGYAERLSPYEEKGRLNLRDAPDPPAAVLGKSRLLARRIQDAEHVVVHTGAGFSTSCGIRDFRGVDGVWTNERKRTNKLDPGLARKPAYTPAGDSITFENAKPSLAHMVLVALQRAGLVHYVISQNVDGLHLRSSLPRDCLSELHGNLFMEWCPSCDTEYFRDIETETVGFKSTQRPCTNAACSGEATLTDKALDWEDALPEPDYSRAISHSKRADLSIIVGSSCQMNPARHLPFRGTRREGGVALCNLSRTDFDARVAINVREKCDVTFAVVAAELGIRIPAFERRSVLVLTTQADEDAKGAVWEVYAKQNGRGRRIPWVESVEFKVHRGGNEDVASVEIAPYVQRFPEDRVVAATVRMRGGATVELEADMGVDGDVEKEIVVAQAEYQSNADAMVRELEEEARRRRKVPGESKDVQIWFCRGSRRGWMVCALCGAEVWSGKGKREGHLQECMGSSLGDRKATTR